MNDYSDIVEELHKLADWVEKANNVQCHSVPRKAAYIIDALTEENRQFRILLNKKDYTILERVQMLIGKVMLKYYLLKKSMKRK